MDDQFCIGSIHVSDDVLSWVIASWGPALHTVRSDERFMITGDDGGFLISVLNARGQEGVVTRDLLRRSSHPLTFNGS